MGVQRSSVILFVVGTLGLVFLVTGCLLIHFIPQILHNGIEKNVKINSDSAAYDNWKSPKSPIYFQAWVFDVLNPEAVLNGSSKPSLVQKGPYTYREKREKFNITFHDNGTVDYRQTTTYAFVPEMSRGMENDTICTINIPMITVLYKLGDSNILIKEAVKLLLKRTSETLFIHKTVGELLWGYYDEFLDELERVARITGMDLNVSSTFGLFHGSNGTDDGVYEIYTGQRDIKQLGEIASWKGQMNLSFWTSDYANQINGSDGSFYAPDIDRSATKYLFSSDLCRSIGMDYADNLTYQGIHMDRFVAPELLFANVTVNPNNAGFCTPHGTCLPSGLLNVSACRDGAPIVMSMPHFLGCDSDIINSVDGLHPVKEEHQSFLDIEPITGVTMKVAKRLQINIFLDKVDGFDATDKLERSYLPVMWLNESAAIDHKDAEAFKSGLFGRMRMMDGIKYSLIAIGGFIMMAVIGVLVFRTLKQNKYRRFGLNGDESLEVVT